MMMKAEVELGRQEIYKRCHLSSVWWIGDTLLSGDDIFMRVLWDERLVLINLSNLGLLSTIRDNAIWAARASGCKASLSLTICHQAVLAVGHLLSTQHAGLLRVRGLRRHAAHVIKVLTRRPNTNHVHFVGFRTRNTYGIRAHCC